MTDCSEYVIFGSVFHDASHHLLDLFRTLGTETFDGLETEVQVVKGNETNDGVDL